MSSSNKRVEKNKSKKFLMIFTLLNFFIAFVFYLNKKPKGIIGSADGVTEIALLNGFTLNLYIIFFVVGVVSLFSLIIVSKKIKK